LQGGLVELSLRLAEKLGDRVRLGTPVRAIDQTSSKRVVVHSDALRVSARECVVAMAPFDARAIAFTPSLPLKREYIHRNYQSVSYLKVQAVYEQPFWREDGLSGVCWSDRQVAATTRDNSPPDGTPGVLMSLLTPPGEGLWGLPDDIADDPDARRGAVLESFAAYFGPRALKPIQYLEKDWLAEPYTAGCMGTMPPGFLTRSREMLTAPVGRVHWCHSELGTSWGTGVWVNGGVECGERVAREVAARL
jgi:monoamine oxidase